MSITAKDFMSRGQEIPETKICRECGVEYPATPEFFYRQKRSTNGLHNKCKSCVSKDSRNYMLQRKYDITQEEYEEILEKQEGNCFICHESPDKRLLAVDHNHDTGKVRGLLCHKCNTVIGLLNEDKERFQRAIAYLDEYSEEE